MIEQTSVCHHRLIVAESELFKRISSFFFPSLHLHFARARLGHAAVLPSQRTVKFDPFAPVGPKLHETPDGKNDGRR